MSSFVHCESLDAVVKLVQSNFHCDSRYGVRLAKLWRQYDGSRIPLEYTTGVRIKNIEVFNNNTIIIEQHSHGTLFQSRKLHSFDSTLYLPDLFIVNIYDYSVEFWSLIGLNFVILDQTYSSKIAIMSQWIHDKSQTLRAQWYKDDESKNLIDHLSGEPMLHSQDEVFRNLDI